MVTPTPSKNTPVLMRWAIERIILIVRRPTARAKELAPADPPGIYGVLLQLNFDLNSDLETTGSTGTPGL